MKIGVNTYGPSVHGSVTRSLFAIRSDPFHEICEILCIEEKESEISCPNSILYIGDAWDWGDNIVII